ncbi:hypothetical protein [Nostoc sp.]|uniref:hypothetical protein n=1 Tax=Nostoc sp. TaxID=1180 RepID=UPI002FFA234A
MNNNIILPSEDIRDTLAIASGHDENGQEINFEQMIIANTAMVGWLNGRVDADFYFDVLAQTGLDPFEHLTPVFDIVYG